MRLSQGWRKAALRRFQANSRTTRA
jgi:hypothetical protein